MNVFVISGTKSNDLGEREGNYLVPKFWPFNPAPLGVAITVGKTWRDAIG